MRLKHTLIILLSCITFSGFSQKPTIPTATGDSKIAKDNFSYLNFKDAMIEYEAFYKSDSSNSDYAYKLGVCYFETKKDINKALHLLQKASKDDKTDPNVWYYLGLTNQILLKYDDAITSFTKYKTKSKDDQQYSAKRQIEMCNNAKEFIKKPVNVTFENLGNEVNSDFPDYNPYITTDESALYYTSRRDKNTGKTLDYDGFFTSDIYSISPKNGQFNKIRNMGPMVNTDLVEEIVGIGDNGNTIYLYYDNFQSAGDLFFSSKKGKTFLKSAPIVGTINSKNIESSSSSNPSNTMLVFTSDQEGSIGGKDLWISRQLPNGEWGPAENIKALNTEADECFPYFSPDGKYMYFASSGFNSMGGFDIFKTSYNDSTKTWAKPTNLGYPVNTSDDNTVISFASNPRYAYMAIHAPNTTSYTDIYRLTFNDIPPSYTLVQGAIILPDSSNLFTSGKFTPPSVSTQTTPEANPASTAKGKGKTTAPVVAKPEPTAPQIEVTIKVQNKATKKDVGIYRPNSRTGIYYMNLPTGEYTLILSGNGLQTTTDELVIYDKDLYKKERNKPLIVRIQEIATPIENQQ